MFITNEDFDFPYMSQLLKTKCNLSCLSNLKFAVKNGKKKNGFSIVASIIRLLFEISVQLKYYNIKKGLQFFT